MNANPKIFVANLSPAVTEDNLRRVFGVHGTVMEASLLRDRVSGQSRGLAFVTMKSSAEAQLAMDGLNARALDGCPLVLNSAKPRRGSAGPGRRRRAGGPRRNWGRTRRV